MIIIKFAETAEEKAIVAAICAQIDSAGPDETVTVTEAIPAGEYKISATPTDDGLELFVTPA
jgi:hypothetical protein